MTARDEAYAHAARLRATDAAMALARAGMSREQIKEIMLDVAEDASDEAADWADAFDRKQAAIDEGTGDREDFADEYARDSEREYGT